DAILHAPISKISEAVKERVDYCAPAVALRDRGDRRGAVALLLADATPRTAAAVRAAIFQFIDAADTLSLRLAGQARARQLNSDRLALALAGFGLAACLLAVWSIVQERNSWREAQQAMVETNEALERARAEAIASDAAKTRFLATASHDLRQPLHALSLYISALERRVDTPETRKILSNMERATRSMTGMFASLLDLARIQSGVTKPEFTDLSLQDAFTRIGAEFADGSVEIIPSSLAVRADPHMLEGVLRNFITNALKHGGGWARLEAQRVSGGVAISVTDRGPGVPADKAALIFEEFAQLDPRAEGLGLGLAIAKRLCDLLHAQLSVTAAPEGGAVFTLVLTEALTGAAQDSVAAEPPAPHALADAPIIVIDDDALALEAVAQALRDAGAQVRTGASVADLEALIAEGATARVLVMDLRLDGEFRGVAALNMARARMRPKPAAVIVTGDTAPETLAMLQASGYAWIVKPVQRGELIAIVTLAAAMATHAAERRLGIASAETIRS
ncbi:MAG: ATP-binding protein, partial [Hyphomonadaceae bacterium]